MAERFKAAVLKTVGRDERPGGSNPPLSASSFNSPSQPNSPPYSRLIPTRSWWGEGDSNPQGCVALKTGAARLFSEARSAPRANRINFRTCENLDIPLSPLALSIPLHNQIQSSLAWHNSTRVKSFREAARPRAMRPIGTEGNWGSPRRRATQGTSHTIWPIIWMKNSNMYDLKSV